ncbi:MAG: ribosome recycling factor [Candidatus Stahlbacteria bacterium]|nr:ribosome recycling factor [Candidatus Stahlbacteria bacterium]
MKELQDLYSDVSDKMVKTIELVKHEFTRIRTGRASPGLVEELKVESYGTALPLKQLASIACPDPRLIVIRPWDANLISEIEKAIMKSGIGLTPTKDGVVIKLPVPILTEERRREIVKVIHKIVEDSKIALRNVRRDGIARLESIDGISEDDKFKGKEKLQKITDEWIEKLSTILINKEKEIMEE